MRAIPIMLLAETAAITWMWALGMLDWGFTLVLLLALAIVWAEWSRLAETTWVPCAPEENDDGDE